MENISDLVLPILGFSVLTYLVCRYYSDEDVTILAVCSLLYFVVAPIVAVYSL
jgi:hypothetical protein